MEFITQRTKKPRCQEPKKKYKRKQRIKERIQIINLKGSPIGEPFKFMIWNFFGSWIFGSWFFVQVSWRFLFFKKKEPSLYSG